MIIMDLQQVMLSNIMMQLGNHTNAAVDENMVRHMVLNSIRAYRSRHRVQYGELIIACDNKNYWRRQLFPYYKAGRKKSQAASELNWKQIFDCLNLIRSELKEFFPYRVISVESAEADDIIGTLCAKYGDDGESVGTYTFLQAGKLVAGPEEILILSGDKDFIQLHKYTNVKQYDPVRKKMLNHPNPKLFLKEHILRGDRGDGVPNFLSADNCLVTGDRQRKITQKKLDEWLVTEDWKDICPTEQLQRNYKRNEQLIDLTKIPSNIAEQIMAEYHAQQGKQAKNLMQYFMDHKLRNLVEAMGDFV